MNKTTVFIGLIVFGIFGRWIIVPSILKIKSESDRKSIESKFNRSGNQSCLDDDSCKMSDLLHPIFLSEEYFSKARKYITTNYQIFREQDLSKAIFLKALFISDSKEDLEFVYELSTSDKKTFLDSIFLCTHISCINFIQKNISILTRDSPNIISLKLELKMENRSWKDRDKILNELIAIIEKKLEIDELLSLLDIIPNHPKVRKSLETNFLKIKKSLNIKKAAVHLSRYNRGWHDRKYSLVLNSNSIEHIEAFLTSMIIDCPQKLREIYFLSEDKLSDDLFKLALDQGHYLFKQGSELALKYKLDKEKFIEEAKCSKQSQPF